jgi:menaquinone-dependent protoporphyrinogen IX oxidase
VKGAIVYYSNYGSTKQYAKWIAEETGFELFDQKSDSVPLEQFDTVVIGSPILKMEPFLAGWVKDNWDRLRNKRVFLYSTSGAEAGNPGLQSGFRRAFPTEIVEQIDYTPFQGRMVWSNLKPMHKMMMRIGSMIEKDPRRKKEMLLDVDGVDRSAIAPLVSRLQATK